MAERTVAAQTLLAAVRMQAGVTGGHAELMHERTFLVALAPSGSYEYTSRHARTRTSGYTCALLGVVLTVRDLHPAVQHQLAAVMLPRGPSSNLRLAKFSGFKLLVVVPLSGVGMALRNLNDTLNLQVPQRRITLGATGHLGA